MKTRKNIRLKEYDYSKNGYYFVTICTKDMLSLFGKIVDFKMTYNDYGKKLYSAIDKFSIKNVKISYYQVMPNHLHLIFEFENDLDIELSNVFLY